MQLVPILILVSLIYTHGERIVCYYTNYAQYRLWKFFPEHIDANLCTHIIYAYAQIQGLGLESVEWNDARVNNTKGMYARVVDLKEKHPHLKVLLAIAGNHKKYFPYLPVVATPAAMWLFVQNTITFIRKHNFDGVDVNWIYPGTLVRPIIRKETFVALYKVLREGIESDSSMWRRPQLLLVATLPAIKEIIDLGYDPVSISHYADFVSLLTFDLHGAWDGSVGFNAPLYSNPKDTGYRAFLSTDWVARYYISLGVEKEKINIGIPMYGRTFTLAKEDQFTVGSLSNGPGQPGWVTQMSGFLAYYEVCNITNSNATVVDCQDQRNRYVVKGNQWIGSDDITSVTEKACYVRKHGFGGVMIRSLDLDDYTGDGCKNGKYPLLQAIVKILRDSDDGICSQFKTPRMQSLATHVVPHSSGVLTLSFGYIALWSANHYH